MKRIMTVVCVLLGLLAFTAMPIMAVAAAPAFQVMPVAGLHWIAVPLQTSPPPFDMQIVLDVIIQFATLAGVAAGIAAIVNVCKYFGLVGDGNAGRVVAALDLAAIIALVALKIFAPTVSVDFVDQQAAIFASIVVAVLGYVMELKVSKAAHDSLSEMSVPLIGASHTDKTVLQLAPRPG